MQAEDTHPGGTKVIKDYRSLPPGVRLDDTIASVDADPLPDPRAGRNVDLLLALRDD